MTLTEPRREYMRDYLRRYRADPTRSAQNERRRAAARRWKQEHSDENAAYMQKWRAQKKLDSPPKPRQPTVRALARMAGLTRYPATAPCNRGHQTERLVSNGACVICHTDATLKRQAANGYAAQKRWMETWRKSSPEAKLVIALRTRLYKAVRRNQKSGSAVRDLGCSIPEFKEYIHDKFQDGMSWDNYGRWHLDHIRPLASFNLADRGELLKACHYTNYQPLWALDNYRKGKTLRSE